MVILVMLYVKKLVVNLQLERNHNAQFGVCNVVTILQEVLM